MAARGACAGGVGWRARNPVRLPVHEGDICMGRTRRDAMPACRCARRARRCIGIGMDAEAPDGAMLVGALAHVRIWVHRTVSMGR
jgi:hypothetical protein